MSHETIYRTLYVQSRGASRRELTENLRTERRIRRPGSGNRQRASGSGNLVGMIHIGERPPEAGDRAVPGHWEGDLILGKGMSAIGTLVERSSRDGPVGATRPRWSPGPQSCRPVGREPRRVPTGIGARRERARAPAPAGSLVVPQELRPRHDPIRVRAVRAYFVVRTNRREHPSASGQGSGSALRSIQVQPEDVVDVFVYVAVLNLAIEYLPAVISEGFTLSLLTAVLLKLSLELILVVKGRAVTRFRGAMTVRAKLTAALLLWAIAAGSKIVVLELVNLVFGDAVSLGGFLSVTLLVVTLLLSRAAVRRLLASGHVDASNAAGTDRAPSP